jgi:uncharacterized surface protein with fasciclin (FAS1) repeats
MKLKHLLAVAVVPLALVAAGCSDDGGDSGAGAADQPTEESGGESGGSTETTAAPAEDMTGQTMGSRPEPGADTSELNIAQIAAGTAATQTLTRLVLQAGLAPVVVSPGPFTVFAPVEDAFAALPEGTLPSLVADTPQLQSVLTLHVVPGVYTSDDLKAAAGTSLPTANGGSLLVEVDGDDIIVGGAKVVVPDIKASNGIVHAVDSVITAPNG